MFNSYEDTDNISMNVSNNKERKKKIHSNNIHNAAQKADKMMIKTVANFFFSRSVVAAAVYHTWK